ncbi:peptide ABC transporter substrate-binding protein [Mesorhizobium sp. WSM4307]|uniref:ABC transporter substrate-binding protein n=1 Tax=unclassified Mesorhizobium TaxID=325217 RepID=UPI000BB0BF57|nr:MULTISPECIES: peptide ABC transporter substrate-binding protein [unclassified Mesorhizobium]PBB24553.1 ABC transporter [Mesorhizobium sp. WSM4304]PBB74772.1 ABC transporter [Mesorhizobium sp. WSM4308]TRC73354.1 peptide ABC transporter substrate-binding protein [Mesorhizobium sp. WSM4315]TRC83683.1 peptide ABC transporter substrate-binding protein [Mesorhizobium sp. WSM4307]
MEDFNLDRRSVLKALLAGTAAPFIASSHAFAASVSCSDQIVRVAGLAAPDTMNPFATWSSFWPTTFTYDFLVGFDAQRHPDRLGFAKEWSIDDKELTWTFTIWPGMKWSDGKPATAKDVAFTYEYLKKSIGTPNELNVGWNNTSGLAQVESIEVVDETTLKITTKKPTRWPVDNTIMIVPEHIWSSVSYADARSTFRNDPPLVGTGPMIVSEFQQGQFARLTPNAHFRTGQPKIAGLIFSFFPSADSIAQGLKSGNLDYGMNLTAAQWSDLSKDEAIVVGKQRTEARNYLAFNTASGKGAGSTKALQDKGFRDAIGYAIDQKMIAERAFRGNADPGVGLVMPSATSYYSELEDIKRHFDLEEAARRLDAAGYKDADGDGVREDKDGNAFQLELITGTSSGTIETPMAAVQLVAGWLGQIGIPVSVTQLDPGGLDARTASPDQGGGKWDLLICGGWLSLSAPDLLALGRSDQNRAYWQSSEFDQLISEVEGTADIKKSQALVDKAVRLIYQEAPFIMLAYPMMLEARRKDCFQGWGTEDMLAMWSYFPFDRLKAM